MSFLVKFTLRLLLLLAFSALLLEIGLANYDHFQTHPAKDLQSCLKEILKNSNFALNHALDLLLQGNLVQLKLVKELLWLFDNKIYWIVLTLLLVICYYEYRNRRNVAPVLPNAKVSQDRFKAEAARQTQQEVSKLVNSQKFKEYERRKQQQGYRKQVIDVDQENDQDFTKDWEQNQKKIFD